MNISLIGWSHLGSLIVKNLRQPWRMLGLKNFVQVQTFQWRPFMPLHNFCYPIDEFHWASQTDVQLQSHSHVRFLITSKCICKSDARCLQPAGWFCCLLSDVWDATCSHLTPPTTHPTIIDSHNFQRLSKLKWFTQECPASHVLQQLTQLTPNHQIQIDPIISKGLTQFRLTETASTISTDLQSCLDLFDMIYVTGKMPKELQCIISYSPFFKTKLASTEVGPKIRCGARRQWWVMGYVLPRVPRLSCESPQ